MRGPFSGVVAMVAMLAGCSAVLGIDDLRLPTLHGTVRDIETDAVSNVSIALYRDPKDGAPNSALVQQATTNRDGKFELSFPTGLPLHGYLALADDPRFVRTFSHLTQPLVDHSDFDVEVRTATADGLRKLASDVHMTQTPTRSVVIAQVVEAGGSGLPKVTVHARDDDTGMDVLQICGEDAMTSFPCAPGTTGTTGEGGTAWLFDVPETSSLTITAVDADGQLHTVSFPVVAGPSLVFTPVPPATPPP